MPHILDNHLQISARRKVIETKLNEIVKSDIIISLTADIQWLHLITHHAIRLTDKRATIRVRCPI